jgi:hypothetical protein
LNLALKAQALRMMFAEDKIAMKMPQCTTAFNQCPCTFCAA